MKEALEDLRRCKKLADAQGKAQAGLAKAAAELRQTRYDVSSLFGSDSDSDMVLSGASDEEEEEEAPPPPQKKKQKVAQVAETEQERVAAASAALAAKDEALRSNMHEVAAQSYEHVSAWQRGERGPPMTEPSAFDVQQDLVAIQQAKSPMAIVAAMSNLVKTLTDAHYDSFKGETCEVPTAHEQRLRAACNQAVQFSDATMVRLDKAIQELTEARAMGHEVLKQIGAPGPASASSTA